MKITFAVRGGSGKTRRGRGSRPLRLGGSEPVRALVAATGAAPASWRDQGDLAARLDDVTPPRATATASPSACTLYQFWPLGPLPVTLAALLTRTG